MKAFHLNAETISKIDEIEFSYTRDRMNVIRDLRQEPESAQYVEQENLRGLMFPGRPNPYFNRILISGPVQPETMQHALKLYKEKKVNPDVEISPGSLDEALARFLRDNGYTQTKFHPVFLKPVHELAVRLSNNLQVKQISSSDELTAFQELYVRGWKVNPDFAPIMKTFIEGWIRLPAWKLYLAYNDNQPIGCATLYVKDSIAHLADAATPEEFRGRGAQTALLLARIEEAKNIGADLIFSRADFGSISQRNMEKQGIRISYTRALWEKINGAESEIILRRINGDDPRT